MQTHFLRRILLVMMLGGLLLAFVACDADLVETPIITIDIENGQFDVNAVLLDTSNNSNQGPLGSGTLSFTFSGDISGTFNISGSLASNQSANDGVGALIGPFEAQDVQGEGFSFLGFHPTGSGKADVFLVGMKQDVAPPSSIAPGDYGIGPLGNFLGIYLIGIDIDEFWTAQTTGTDIIQASDRAYVFSEGILTVAVRDTTHLVGRFSGTATKQVGLSKPSLRLLDSIVGR